MTRGDAVAIAVLLVLVGALAELVTFTDRVFLPRHPDALDSPWRQDGGRLPGVEDEPLNYVASDKFNLIYPDQRYVRTELGDHGRLAEWNPYILGGVPHAANPLAAVFYPPGWVQLLAAPEDGPLVAAALHLFLAALFVFMLMRVTGLGSFAAAFGGACFAFSGWTAAHLHNTQLLATVTWWPLALFAIEARLRGRGRWSLMTLSLAIAMMWLAGFPQFALMGTLVCGVWAAVGICARGRRDDRGGGRRHAGGLLVFTLVGFLLASVQLIPTMELMEYSGHQSSTPESLVDQRFRPAGWLGLVLPGFMGDASDADWSAHWGARIALAERPAPPVPAVMNWGERTVYPGLLTLAFALVGVLWARDRVRWCLVAMGLLGGVLATSAGLIEALAEVPLFAVGAPARAVVLPALALSCLAAAGFQVLLDGGTSRPRRSVSLLTWFTAVPLAALLTVVTWSLVDPDGLLAVIVDVLKSTGAGERLVGGALPATGACVELLRGDFADLQGDLIRLALLGGAAWVLLAVRLRRPEVSLRLGIVAAVLVMADLLCFFVPPNLPIKEDGVFRATPGIRWLQENLGQDRFMRVSADEGEALAEYPTFFVPNTAMLYGLRDAQGWREQIPRWYPELWRGTAAAVMSVGVSGVAADKADSPVLDLARVRYLVASRRVPSLDDRLVYPPPEKRDGPVDLWIYANPDARPRAWMVHQARVQADDEVLERLRRGDGAVDREVLIDAWPDGFTSPPASSAGDAHVEVARDTPGRLVLTVKADGPGWLVVNDTWCPGWRATAEAADGAQEELPVVRAWTAFMAVPVESGEQRVVLEYVPASVTWGVVLTGIGWIGLLLLPLVRRTPSSAGHAPEVSGPADDEEVEHVIS